MFLYFFVNSDIFSLKRDVDKFAELGLTKEQASKVDVAMIGESPVNIECKVIKVLELGSHHMFMAEVVAVHADKKYMDENYWRYFP